MKATIVIIGAGQAGGTVAALLRQYKFEGSIHLLGEEELLPYHRPPLSKAWLKGEIADAQALEIRPLEFYRDADIALRRGVRVEAIDRPARQVVLRSGERIAYDILILATGSRPIRLGIPGADLDGVLVLRSAKDADSLRERLRVGGKVAIIGGGYIGLEVAASVVTLGGRAAVLERTPRLLARSASPQLAEFLRQFHQARGVSIHLGADVVGFEGTQGRVAGVRLASGVLEQCDLALVGVGVVTNQELALAAGLHCDRGVVVDDHARTSDSCIYAVGDCTRRASRLYGRMISPESVQSAVEQARQAATHITGRQESDPEVPWNWSDQYDLKLQVAGFPFDVNQTVVRGDPASNRFAVFHLMDGCLRQVEAVNAAAEFMVGRRLILSQAHLNVCKLADSAVSMKLVELQGAPQTPPAEPSARDRILDVSSCSS